MRKGMGSRRNGKIVVQQCAFFVIRRAHRGATATEGGTNQECRVWEAGSPPPLSGEILANIFPWPASDFQSEDWRVSGLRMHQVVLFPLCPRPGV